jgi:hypothetical protein
MSEGITPQPPPEPTPPSPGGQPAEPFQAKAQRFVNKLMPPVDPATDTPEAKLQRTLYLLIAVGIVVFVLCGLFYWVFL